MIATRVGALLTACAIGACGSSKADGESNSGGVVVPDEPVPGVAAECGSVRLTSYAADDRGWCEFSGSHEELPDFVRDKITLAIAEPYNGSSYGGDPGEACGECWEIDTINATRVVMVNNLCPVEGNPLCAGGHFHFDLSEEAAAALGAGGLDVARARRIPCPVSGAIHAQINDHNEWGYLRVAFYNHRFPIRTAEYRAADGQEWLPVQRSGGAWHVLDDQATFADGGPGGVFRFTSPTGETIEGTEVLTSDAAGKSTFDTGAQFAEATPEGESCEFVPPGDVYDEQWGGIDQVRWQCNPWGNASCSETAGGCADGSASCVLVENLEQWAGFHVYYRQSFPTSTFSKLSLKLRAQSGAGDVAVAPSYDGERCAETTVTVGDEWVEAIIDVASSCTSLSELNALTVGNQSDTMALLVDEIRYE